MIGLNSNLQCNKNFPFKQGKMDIVQHFHRLAISPNKKIKRQNERHSSKVQRNDGTIFPMGKKWTNKSEAQNPKELHQDTATQRNAPRFWVESK